MATNGSEQDFREGGITPRTRCYKDATDAELFDRLAHYCRKGGARLQAVVAKVKEQEGTEQPPVDVGRDSEWLNGVFAKMQNNDTDALLSEVARQQSEHLGRIMDRLGRDDTGAVLSELAQRESEHLTRFLSQIDDVDLTGLSDDVDLTGLSDDVDLTGLEN